MFKHLPIKKYGIKLLPKLQKRYGELSFYNANQVRSTIYQCNFNPKYLPLGYILFLDDFSSEDIIKKEFPQLSIAQYKQEIRLLLGKHKYYGHLQNLASEA